MRGNRRHTVASWPIGVKSVVKPFSLLIICLKLKNVRLSLAAVYFYTYSCFSFVSRLINDAIN
jgi:hypothetical protein